MSVQRVSVGGFADELLVVLFRHMREPWRLAVCKAMHALLLAQNNPKLKVHIKVNHEQYLASNAHGKDELLLAALQQHCSRYDVQYLKLRGLNAEFQTANFGRVVRLVPELTELDLTGTVIGVASFAAALAELTALHTLCLSGNTEFMRDSMTGNLVLHTALTKLDLGNCQVTEFHLRMLMSQNLALTDLNLSNNHLNRTNLLPDLLTQLSALKSINLSLTQLKGGYLVRVMRTLGVDLKVLRLAGLPVTDPRKELYPKYTKARLERQDASDKRIFSELCRFSSLEELDLNGMYVGVHASTLAAALGVMPELKSLNLSNTDIEWRGAQHIATSLTVMPLLERVAMYNVDIGADGARAFVAAVAGRTPLVKLQLEGRNFRMDHL